VFALDLFEERRHLSIVAVIYLHGYALAAAAGDLFCGLAHSAGQRMGTRRHGTASDIDRGSLRPERHGDALADSTAGTGDDGDFACQRAHFGPLPKNVSLWSPTALPV
jgi:hypothetical protein